MHPCQAQGGLQAIRNRQSHVRGFYESAESEFGCIDHGGRAVAEVGLGRRVGVFQVRLGCRVVASEPVSRELRDGDGRQDGDDPYNDDQFDQRESLLSFFPGEIAEHDDLRFRNYFMLLKIFHSPLVQ